MGNWQRLIINYFGGGLNFMADFQRVQFCDRPSYFLIFGAQFCTSDHTIQTMNKLGYQA